MRLLITATALAFITACSGASSPSKSETAAVAIQAPAEDTRLLAVMSYADWCGSCKALDPKVQAVKAAGTFEGVEFFTIDYTKKNDEAFFADADTLGVGDTMRATFEDKIKTGKLYLINRDSGAVVSIVDKNMDEATIAEMIAEASALS